MSKEKSTGVALRGGDSGSGRESGSPEIHTDPITGQKYTVGISSWGHAGSSPMPLKFPIEGVSARKGLLDIRWTWLRYGPIDEADARDAQCRAGWPDTGYGFYGLTVTTEPDGLVKANWCCGVTCE